MSLAWAGGGGVEQVQHVAQNVAQHTEPEEVSHGVLHWIIEVIPGGEWSVIGLMAFGASGLVWHKFHKQIENFVWLIVKKKMEQRKP